MIFGDNALDSASRSRTFAKGLAILGDPNASIEPAPDLQGTC